MRRILLLLLTSLALAGTCAGASTASPLQHVDYSDTWHSTTIVTGLQSCPLFGTTQNPFYEFGEVDLTDHINSTYTPLAQQPLYQIDSVGSVRGVIDAPDGTYHVAGGGFKEHRIDQLTPLYFSGTGHVTISGPGGTVDGRATFQDLSAFPPPEFDLLFTDVTGCHLS